MSTAKKILVTGGTGFTGSALVNRLLDQGHQVRVVDNQKGRYHDQLAARGAEIHIDSVTNKDRMDELTRGMDIVQHLAAAFRAINLPKSAYWDVNVNGTRYLLEAAERHGVKRFVYCSTCGVHGNIAHPPAAETAPIAPADYYQFTKYEGEKVAHEFMAKGMDISIVRPAAIYGPGDPERWAMLLKRAKTGSFPMLGDGKTTYHPLYIDNLVDALVLVQDNPASKGQTYLIADEKYYALTDLVEAAGKVLGKPVRIVHVPYRPVWLVALLTEAVCAPFRITPPIFRRRVDWFIQDRAFDIGKAKRELGYQPKVDLLTGLKKTADWCVTEGIL